MKPIPRNLPKTTAAERERTLRLYRDSYFLRDVAMQAKIENVEAIFQHLIRSTGSPADVSNFALLYYRSKGGAEVDFMIEEPDCIRAVEIKSSAHVEPKDLRNLKGLRAMAWPKPLQSIPDQPRDRISRSGWRSRPPRKRPLARPLVRPTRILAE